MTGEVKNDPAVETNSSQEPAQMSLEDVYQKYNIQPTQTQPDQSVQEPAAARPPDGDQNQPHLEDRINRLTHTLEKQQKLIEQQAKDASERAEKDDLDQALEFVEKNVNLPKKEYSKLVKLALASKYQEDMRFAAAWDNRRKDPRAFSAVMQATLPELQNLFSIKDNDQIAQNQLALDNAVKGSGADPQEPTKLDEKLAGLSDGEFQAAWLNMSQGRPPV